MNYHLCELSSNIHTPSTRPVHHKLHHDAERRAEGLYHGLSHLESICVEVELVQTLLDALPGGACARREQHAEVMYELLESKRSSSGSGSDCLWFL